MHLKTRQKAILTRAGAASQTQEFITLGTVVDTNDPQQMGRVRAVCPAWGDTYNTPVEDLPWCIYMAPFGGQMSVGSRGPGTSETEGGVAYGLWAIPKINAQVIIACLDGDTSIRVYMGCVYDQFTPHTMPHGRWVGEGNANLPQGPVSSREKPVEPLNTNMQQAFPGGQQNLERASRAADYSVSAVTAENTVFSASNIPDDDTRGYPVNRGEPDSESELTGQIYDSQVYAMVSPGFHAISMDDRQENCRIRFRTSAGHQILLDDTNERIYIQTAKGNNWIEMDQSGNIDVYSAGNISVRSAKDINFTADKTIRLSAKQGVHMYSEDEIRLLSKKDLNIRSEQNIRAHSLQSTYLQGDQEVHLQAGTNFYIEAAQAIHEKCGSNFHISGGENIHLNAGVQIRETAEAIHLNGPSATVATSATAPSEQASFLTSRVPDHEPWARTMTANDTTQSPEFPYSSDQVNRSERGTTIPRGEFWRR